MPSDPDHQHHVRRVHLPSGKAIEVVYFGEASRTPAAAPELHLCAACGCDLVQPVSWEERGPDQWDVVLRCPNCARERSGTYFQDVLDRLDEWLDRGTEALVCQLKSLVQANMEADVARFAAALSDDLIVPEDF